MKLAPKSASLIKWQKGPFLPKVNSDHLRQMVLYYNLTNVHSNRAIKINIFPQNSTFLPHLPMLISPTSQLLLHFLLYFLLSQSRDKQWLPDTFKMIHSHETQMSSNDMGKCPQQPLKASRSGSSECVITPPCSHTSYAQKTDQ